MTELKKTILLNRKDNIAMAIMPIKKDDSVAVAYNNETVSVLTSMSDIEMYHKIAIKPIEKGSLVYKYGEVIGMATDYINAGQHVHIYNIESVMTK